MGAVELAFNIAEEIGGVLPSLNRGSYVSLWVSVRVIRRETFGRSGFHEIVVR